MFFLDETDDGWDAGLCGGTGDFSPDEVAAVAGQGVAPEAGGPGPHPVLAEYAGIAGVGAGGSLALLSALLWLRMRKT